jgi:hypothetical protein
MGDQALVSRNRSYATAIARSCRPQAGAAKWPPKCSPWTVSNDDDDPSTTPTITTPNGIAGGCRGQFGSDAAVRYEGDLAGRVPHRGRVLGGPTDQGRRIGIELTAHPREHDGRGQNKVVVFVIVVVVNILGRRRGDGTPARCVGGRKRTRARQEHGRVLNHDDVFKQKWYVMLGVDLIIGLVPLAGEAFDMIWYANVKNVNLVHKHYGTDLLNERAAAPVAAMHKQDQAKSETASPPIENWSWPKPASQLQPHSSSSTKGLRGRRIATARRSCGCRRSRRRPDRHGPGPQRWRRLFSPAAVVAIVR